MANFATTQSDLIAVCDLISEEAYKLQCRFENLKTDLRHADNTGVLFRLLDNQITDEDLVSISLNDAAETLTAALANRDVDAFRRQIREAVE